MPKTTDHGRLLVVCLRNKGGRLLAAAWAVSERGPAHSQYSTGSSSGTGYLGVGFGRNT